MKHLCDRCIHDYPACNGTITQFGIDVDPGLAGCKYTDVVVKCENYEEICIGKDATHE